MGTAAQLDEMDAIEEVQIPDEFECAAPADSNKSELAAVSASWRRCLADRRVNPDSLSAPDIVTESELKAIREPLGKEVASARQEIDRLYSIVRQEDYVVLLCNTAGVAIQHRGDESQAARFKEKGIWLGGVWSEANEGTNGIGTCIAEERPVLIHRSQHFRSRHVGLTCAGAPIFDPKGKLAMVLDVSSMSNGQAHTMALAVTKVAAREVEERLFREAFRSGWILAAMPVENSQAALLFAIDGDLKLIGADRLARMTFELDDDKLENGVALSTIFEFDRSFFRCIREHDGAGHFIRTGTTEGWQVLVTPPLCGTRQWRSPAELTIHSRPRISLLNEIPILPEPMQSRGGLSPARASRICEYINTRLGQSISLEEMAEVAELSVHHFARAFKQTVGMPPHSYVLQRRIEYAQEMLRNTRLPLSEIALSVGFSDQSHLARHFRKITGVSPGSVRWEQR
jgi:AraC-like DNA-binding protein